MLFRSRDRAGHGRRPQPGTGCTGHNLQGRASGLRRRACHRDAERAAGRSVSGPIETPSPGDGSASGARSFRREASTPGREPQGISSTIHVWVRWCRIESSVAAILVTLLVASRIASFLPRQKKCAVMNMMSRPWSLLYSRIAICGHRFRCDCAQAGAAVPANRSRLRVDNVHSEFHAPVAWCV